MTFETNFSSGGETTKVFMDIQSFTMLLKSVTTCGNVISEKFCCCWGCKQGKLRASRNPPKRAPDRMRGNDLLR